MRDLLAASLVALPLYLAGHDVARFTLPLVAPAQAAFEAMAATERAFVRAASDKGIVRSFIEFFAPDAIAFAGDAITSAQAELAAELSRVEAREASGAPLPPPMHWEPRVGDIAASGDLGWLTGPVQRTAPDGRVRHSCYFSIWRRQPDGTFRVFIDFGTEMPSAAPFELGLRRLAHTSRHGGRTRGDAAASSLAAADRALDEHVRTGPPADAYAAHLAVFARLHRQQMLPLVGRDAVLGWLADQPAFAASEHRGAGASAAGDLGYTYGTYATTGDAQEHGWYLRAWTREASGAWKIAADITQPRR